MVVVVGSTTAAAKQDGQSLGVAACVFEWDLFCVPLSSSHHAVFTRPALLRKKCCVAAAADVWLAGAPPTTSKGYVQKVVGGSARTALGWA